MALVYAQSGNLSFEALGKSLGDGMLHEPLLLAGWPDCRSGLQAFSGAVPPVDARRLRGARLRRFPPSGDGEQNRYLRRGDASVPLCAGRHSEAVRVVLGIIALPLSSLW